MFLKEITIQKSPKSTLYIPDENGNISARNKGIASFYGAPKKVKGYFDCSYNRRLKTLFNGPQEVGDDFVCQECSLQSLQYAPRYVGYGFRCDGNNLTNLKDFHKTTKYIGKIFQGTGNPFESHLLSLCLIQGLRSVYFGNSRLDHIFNDVFTRTDDCSERLLHVQEKLYDAGYDDFAKL